MFKYVSHSCVDQVLKVAPCNPCDAEIAKCQRKMISPQEVILGNQPVEVEPIKCLQAILLLDDFWILDSHATV
jgi:hypothetical protein